MMLGVRIVFCYDRYRRTGIFQLISVVVDGNWETGTEKFVLISPTCPMSIPASVLTLYIVSSALFTSCLFCYYFFFYFVAEMSEESNQIHSRASLLLTAAKKGVIQTNRASSFALSPAVGFRLLGVLSGIVLVLFCVWFFLSRLAFSCFNLNFLQISPKGIAFGKAGVYAVASSVVKFLFSTVFERCIAILLRTDVFCSQFEEWYRCLHLDGNAVVCQNFLLLIWTKKGDLGGRLFIFLHSW